MHRSGSPPAVEAPTLVFVQIPTHFREMIRVAELLQGSPGYRPTVLFMTRYAGVEADIARCLERGIAVITPDDFHRYLEPGRPPARRGLVATLAARIAGALREARCWSATRFGFRGAIRKASISARQAQDRFAAMLPAGFRRAIRKTRFWAPWSAARNLAHAACARVAQAVRACARGLRALARRSRFALSSWRSRIRARAAMAARRLLLESMPPLDEQLRSLPSPVRMVVLGLAALGERLLWLAWKPAAPLGRRLVVAAFGLAYRWKPAMLPAEIQAQHYVWRMVRRMVEDNDIRLLVLPEDNFYYFTNLFVKEVHRRGGIAVVVPFTVVNMLEWAESFHTLASHDAGINANRVIAALFPSWRHRHKGRSLVMPFAQVLSNEYLRIAPPVPWLINSGHADAIAAESPFMMEYYRKAGIEERKLHCTGSLADDVLHRQLEEAPSRREALYARLGLPAGRPMLLCALPPNQLGGAGRPTCDFRDYRELLAWFIEPLAMLAGECNVVVSLHPRITAAEAAVLAGRPVAVATENIAELVPLCRLFVASCSATIRLAMSCAIPVVNYDVYRYDYDEYKTVPGVLTIEDREAYRDAVERLARSSECHEEMRRAQAEFARRMAMLDGKAGQRTVELFERLLGRAAAAESAP